jgi:hypothetical protein
VSGGAGHFGQTFPEVAEELNGLGDSLPVFARVGANLAVVGFDIVADDDGYRFRSFSQVILK